MGNPKGNVQHSNADRSGKKYLFAKSCAFVSILTLSLSFSEKVSATTIFCVSNYVDYKNKTLNSWNLANADTNYLYSDPNYGYSDSGEWCKRELAYQLNESYANPGASAVLVRLSVEPDLGSYISNRAAYEFIRPLTSSELVQYGCLSISSSSAFDGGILGALGDVFIDLLPSSPPDMRIPTILNNMLGQGTLAGNLAITLFNGIWQYLTIIVFVKFYKLLPGKST